MPPRRLTSCRRRLRSLDTIERRLRADPPDASDRKGQQQHSRLLTDIRESRAVLQREAKIRNRYERVDAAQDYAIALEKHNRLKRKLKNGTYSSIAREYGVVPNTIRNMAKRYGCLKK